MYRVIWVVAFLAAGDGSVTLIAMEQSHQTRDNHSKLFQWQASVEYVGSTVLGEWHVFAGLLLLIIQQNHRWSTAGPAS